MGEEAPCVHEEADTRIFARATEAAKRPNKKISSCVVDTYVVDLVIPVVQQLCVDGLLGLQNLRATVGVKSIVLLLSFTHRVQLNILSPAVT